MEKTRLFCRTGEVTALLDLESHVLRYWESRFPKIVRPIRRSDGRRLYRPEDVAALTAIKLLVRQKGLTIKAASVLIDKVGVHDILNNPTRDIFSLWSDDVDTTYRGGASSQSDPNISTSGLFQNEISADVMNGRLRTTLDRLEDIKSRIDGTKAIETGRVAA